MSQHAALSEGRVAVIMEAVSGIGLAAATRFAAMGLQVCIADIDGAGVHRRQGDRHNPVTHDPTRRRVGKFAKLGFICVLAPGPEMQDAV
jgi:NAD(P)-dependent dehydrogenase (short-subunit alcohol dehydrogenase family)